MDLKYKIRKYSGCGFIDNLVRKLWVRLTWIHAISFKPGSNDPVLKEDKWYQVLYYIKRTGKKDILIDNVIINECKEDLDKI